MNLADVLNDLGDALRAIPDLEVFSYLPGDAPMPCAMVGYPAEITYDRAFGRGLDQVAVPVLVLAGGIDDESTRDRLCGYLAGSGPGSVKAAVEGYDADSYGTVRVESVQTEPLNNGGVQVWASIFSITIYGKGAA